MRVMLLPLPTAIALLVAILVVLELGWRIGRRHRASAPEELTRGVGAAEGAVFALLGLVLAFTFSNAAGRFQERRHLIAEETNAIGTAWLRVDLLPPAAQPEVRDLFRRYVDARLAIYASLADERAVRARLAEAQAQQARLWSAATAGSLMPGAPAQAPQLLLPALNEVFDVATLRTVAFEDHPPLAVYVMLAMLVLVSSLLVGFSAAQAPRRRPLHMLSFAVVLALTVYLILELEYPRSGLIRIDRADHVLVEQRAAMG